jgi:hypothetical protein
MHILGSPDFSALEPEMPAVFGHLPHHFYVGFMGGPIDEKSGLLTEPVAHWTPLGHVCVAFTLSETLHPRADSEALVGQVGNLVRW